MQHLRRVAVQPSHTSRSLERIAKTLRQGDLLLLAVLAHDEAMEIASALFRHYQSGSV